MSAVIGFSSSEYPPIAYTNDYCFLRVWLVHKQWIIDPFWSSHVAIEDGVPVPENFPESKVSS